MIYYKIKPEYDNRLVGENRHLVIGNELYTEKEFIKLKLPLVCADRVVIPKSKIFTSFGARFEYKN